MPHPAFITAPVRRPPPPTARRTPTCAAQPPPPATPATGTNARRLAKWLAADWANQPQAMEDPQFWAHVHVCFRPLRWHFLGGYSFYCESAYDYNLGAPYKTSVVRIENDGHGHLELASYKIKQPDEYWMGAYEPQLLEQLTTDQLLRLPEACNTAFVWDESKRMYTASSRPGKGCRIQRRAKEKETYLDSKITLTDHSYSAWDVGRDPETDELVWGAAAGPFDFQVVSRLDHLVPDEQSLAISAPP
uniref:Phycocyanobilin lyase n=1 Tax=Gracilariopsis lemaneiformis TaxID=2782 RepID=A0A5J6RLB9_GRALE|nr:phycocyanobilin lyase [Gracilariopsis lemaneiformis]